MKQEIGVVAALCLALLVAATAQSQSRDSNQRPAAPAANSAAGRPANSPAVSENPTAGYQVQPGDVLQVSVWKEPDLSGQVLVRPDGGFSVPLAGDVNALGKTVEELRLELTQRLGRFVPDGFVTVAVQEINGNKVYVIGQVNEPGEFIVNPRVDVVQALSLAGGTTAFASLHDIFVLRREDGIQRRLPVNFDDVLRGKVLEQNVLLRSGDVVVVP